MFRTSPIIALSVLLVASLANAQQTLQEKLGYPANARVLIIHADDFGMAQSVNHAIEQALENGWVTSASIMVPCPWFPDVVNWTKSHPHADLGIHMVLDSEWQDFRWGPVAPADKVPSLLDGDGYFYDDPSLFKNTKVSEVDTELHAQIDKAKREGIHLSHLDSHMIALTTTPELFAEYQKLGHDYDLPIQLVRNGSSRVPQGFAPAPDALALDDEIEMDPGVPEDQWFDWYKKKLSALKPGVYQMIVHLAYDNEEMRGATHDHPDWGAAWRQSDFDMVRSPGFHEFLQQQGFILTNWRELSARYRGHIHPHL